MLPLDLQPSLNNRFKLSRQELIDFCQRWGITKMAVFGSILRHDFHAESDIDLLITFAPDARQGLLTLAKIKHELESCLHRPIDLVVEASVQMSDNWIRQHEIFRTTQIVYEQGSGDNP
ncbi:nucleotidyltransferase domain-containing protein [Spirulina major CS-329]|uniref:nucleotidyltransferase family protein n=1 Tax=Spirulina TaxID=1154 RepID=UPI00232CF5C7|nr:MULTISPECIES: nucleotidyltransferase domain-containing protein [Spirulina]MDB9494058.1 nucleotidyltransferase domain-containing protein [Spirulina subsalsa CS-330]MDB9504787.1 nucleotidyltransferase domain-containing protein [Spirulina major CS-329]